MTRFLSVLLWTAVFLLLLAAIDQLLVRVPASHPAHVAVADFYRDLRGRALDLARGIKPAAPPAAPGKAPQRSPKSIEGVIEQRRAAPPPVAKPPAGRTAEREHAPRYVYADDRGDIHFAATLAEIPEEYRGKAKPLGE